MHNKNDDQDLFDRSMFKRFFKLTMVWMFVTSIFAGLCGIAGLTVLYLVITALLKYING